MSWWSDMPVTGLDSRFKIGDVVRDVEGKRWEIVDWPPIPGMSGMKGRSQRGCRFRLTTWDKTGEAVRITLARQRDLLWTEEQYQQTLAWRARLAVVEDEDELIPIF